MEFITNNIATETVQDNLKEAIFSSKALTKLYLPPEQVQPYENKMFNVLLSMVSGTKLNQVVRSDLVGWTRSFIKTKEQAELAAGWLDKGFVYLPDH